MIMQQVQKMPTKQLSNTNVKWNALDPETLSKTRSVGVVGEIEEVKFGDTVGVLVIVSEEELTEFCVGVSELPLGVFAVGVNVAVGASTCVGEEGDEDDMVGLPFEGATVGGCSS
mmetsp:Transcript_21749/g.30251  ORF Transcript_21749/g.30251 Transcript_21749/m.30251 type:complete len:115 (+) Transcript_21749:41-385(+)